jgi:phosphoribosylformylglycinamidine synthase
VRAPGANCDLETHHAFEVAGARCERLHVNRLLEKPDLLKQYQVLCIPGGFSYGDDNGAGKILGNQIRLGLYDGIQRFRDDGKLILGVCNGFQVLIKSGVLLPFSSAADAPATLTWNDSGKFEDRWVHLETDGQKSVFFSGIETMYLPVAHAEGKFVPRSEAVLEELERSGQLVLRYRRALPVGETVPYPENPNGSVGNVAAVCDPTGRVCGLMPHPERHIDPLQHPQWTRHKADVGDGLRVFQNAVNYFK